MYTLFLTHVVLTLCMFGIMWFVQLIHYPLLSRIEEKNFRVCEQWYVRSMIYVISPLMVLELITGLWLLWAIPARVALWVVRLNALLLVVLWASSLCVQLPMHWKLAKGFSTRVYRCLVQTNWIRTLTWSVRACLLVGVLYWLLNVN